MINTLLSKRTLTSIGTCVAGEVLPVLSGALCGLGVPHHDEPQGGVLQLHSDSALCAALFTDSGALLAASRIARKDAAR